MSNEAQHIENTSGVSRRQLLAGVVGAAGLELLGGCNPGNGSAERQELPDMGHIVRVESYADAKTVHMKEGDFGRAGQSVRLPDKVERLVRPTLEKVNTVLDPGKKLASKSDNRLQLIDSDSQTGSKKIYLNAYPDYEGKGIEYQMHPGQEYSAFKLERTTFHEGMHVLGTQKDTEGHELVDAGSLRDFRDHAVKMKRAIDFRNGEIGPDFGSYDRGSSQVPSFSRDGLFPLFDESSYDATDGGHPYDNQDELMASGFTVMRYFPKSLIASIETMPAAERRRAVGFMSDLLAAGRSAAADAQAFDNLFNSKLTDYIAGDGRR
jgi:hypothetical protein